MKRLLVRTLSAALLMAICTLSDTSIHAAERPITIAIVIDGATRQEREPLRAYLTKAMGRPVNIRAPDTYGEVVAHLGEGSYDFACLGALMYIRARAKYGVIPLVRRTVDLHYHTVFITGTGSSIYSLSDLKGRQFAFGDIDSTSGHLMAYRELKEAGIDPDTDFRFRYSGSHLATAAMVETGVVDAGAIDETVLQFLIDGGKLDANKVRVFHTSKPYVDYVYVARKDIPDADREKFVRALLALKEGKDDPVLKILRAKQFVVASDQEYAPMRRVLLDLKAF